MAELTTVLADDHSIVRDGIRGMLGRIQTDTGHRFSIVGEASDGIQAIGLVRKHRPDLVILDVSMPLAGGAEVLIELRRWSPQSRVIIFTGIEINSKIAELDRLGVDGILYKGDDSAGITAMLRRIVAGTRVICPYYQNVLDQTAEAETLTKRELQVLNLIVAGHSTPEIAHILNISPNTVVRHRSSLMAKTGTRKTAALIAYALRENLADLPADT